MKKLKKKSPLSPIFLFITPMYLQTNWCPCMNFVTYFSQPLNDDVLSVQIYSIFSLNPLSSFWPTVYDYTLLDLYCTAFNKMQFFYSTKEKQPIICWSIASKRWRELRGVQSGWAVWDESLSPDYQITSCLFCTRLEHDKTMTFSLLSGKQDRPFGASRLWVYWVQSFGLYIISMKHLSMSTWLIRIQVEAITLDEQCFWTSH